MSKTRKILSVLLALAMVFSVLTVSASAAASYETEEDLEEYGYAQEWELVERSNDGTTWVVDVVLTTNYPTGSIQFVVNNTNPAAAVLDYENVELGDDITYDADIKASANGKVLIVPETTADTVTAPEFDGAVVATLKYTYAGTGSATLTIANAPKKADAPAGTLIAARMDDGDIVTGTPIVGQDATVTGSVVIGNAATPPELVAIDGTMGVVDTTRTTLDADNGVECDGYLYGVDPYDAGETVDTVFEVIGDGTMEIIANSLDSECGTGTMVNVLDLDGNVVASYVLIIFGDVNGDGVADAIDASEIELHDSYMLNDTTGRLLAYQEFAGDVNGDYAADAIDASEVELHDSYLLNDETGRINISGIIEAL